MDALRSLVDGHIMLDRRLVWLKTTILQLPFSTA